MLLHQCIQEARTGRRGASDTAPSLARKDLRESSEQFCRHLSSIASGVGVAGASAGCRAGLLRSNSGAVLDTAAASNHMRPSGVLHTQATGEVEGAGCCRAGRQGRASVKPREDELIQACEGTTGAGEDRRRRLRHAPAEATVGDADLVVRLALETIPNRLRRTRDLPESDQHGMTCMADECI